MPHYEKGAVRVRYEEAGAGFPLLVMPGGGLNSRVSNWQTAEIASLQTELGYWQGQVQALERLADEKGYGAVTPRPPH